MRYYSVQEAKWITIGAQAKKPGTKGANGKKHGGVSVLISDDGTILKGPAHMKGKKPDELGGRQKTLGEKPGEKQEPKKYQNLAFGPNGEIAEPDKPKSPPPGAGYGDLRAAAKVEPAPPALPAAKPVKTKAAKAQKPPDDYDTKQDKKHAKNLARLEKSRKDLANIGDAGRTLLAKAPPEMHAKIQGLIDRADAEKDNLATALRPKEFPDMGEPPPIVTDYTPGADYSDSYDDLRKAAAQPAPEPAQAPAPAPAKPTKAPKVAKVAKPEPAPAPTPEPKPEKGETVRAKIARVKAEKEKRYNDTLKKRGKKEADKQRADDKRQAKAEKDALNPAQAEARKKKQVERISKINAARPESLISLVRKEGGISGGDYDYATDIKEFGLKSAMNKRGLKLDDMAKALQNAGHLVVPEGKKAEDVLLAGLQARANSALHNHTGRYDSEYDDFINSREDADNAPGADSDRVAAVISRGEEAGENQGDDDGLAQILGLEPNRSDADEPEPSDYGHPDDYEPEEGDLGDGGEVTGADTSFDFGAPEPEPVKAPAPSPEPAPAPALATAPEPGTGFADLRAAAAKEPEAATITPEPSAASPRDLEKSEQRTPDEHAKGKLLGNRSIFGGLKRTKAEAKEVLAKRIQQILDSPGMLKVATDFGLTPEQTYTTAKINGKWAVIPSHASDVVVATYKGNPVSAEAVKKYGIILPKNYTKQGEMYVAKPSQPEEPEQPKPPEPKKKKPPTQKVKSLTDDPEKFQQGDRFKGENDEEFQVWGSRQGTLTAHPVVGGKAQINKSTEKKFAFTDAAAASNPTHRRDFVPGFDMSQPGRDPEEIAQDRARLAKAQAPPPGEGFADLRAAAAQIKEPQRGWTAERQDFHHTGIGGVNTHAGKTSDGAAEFDELKSKLGANSGEIDSVNLGELYRKHLDAAMAQGRVDKEAFDSAMAEGPTGKNYSRLTALNGEAARRTRAELKEKTGPYIVHNTDGAIAAGYHANPSDMVPGATDTDYRKSSAAIITGPETQAKNYKAIYGKPAKASPALAEPLFGNQPAPEPTPATTPAPGTGYGDLRAAAKVEPEAAPPAPPAPPADLASSTPEAPTSLKVTKAIGYHRQGKTAAPAYLAKISGTHNGKTFNREFQDGDEDTEAKQAAYRRKKGTYSETHAINDGELYEHSQDGDRKLFAVLPSADGKKRREKVSYEMPEISEASRIMGKTSGGASAGTGRGEDIDIPELLAHQHKMALKAGSYKGLTLPDVARDLVASRGGQGEPEPAPAPAPAPTPEPGAGYAELRAAATAEPEKTPAPVASPPMTKTHFSNMAKGSAFSQTVKDLTSLGAVFNKQSGTWSVPTGKITDEVAARLKLKPNRMSNMMQLADDLMAGGQSEREAQQLAQQAFQGKDDTGK